MAEGFESLLERARRRSVPKHQSLAEASRADWPAATRDTGKPADLRRMIIMLQRHRSALKQQIEPHVLNAPHAVMSMEALCELRQRQTRLLFALAQLWQAPEWTFELEYRYRHIRVEFLEQTLEWRRIWRLARALGIIV